MMRRFLCSALFLTACVILSARADEAAKTGKAGKTDSDQHFVTKASGAGLGEVNLGNLAAKKATNPAVKKFAERMVADHTKANAELIRLANKKSLKVASEMTADDQKCWDKLLKMNGADFDREYMTSQVKDHKEAVSLFEKESKDGKDEDLKKWAKTTLPALREHLKMAQDIHDKVKGGGKATTSK